MRKLEITLPSYFLGNYIEIDNASIDIETEKHFQLIFLIRHTNTRFYH